MDRRRLRVVILPTGTMTRVSLRTPPPLPRYHADVIIPFDQVCSVTCATSDRGFCPHVGAWCRSMGFTSGSGATNLTMLRFATRFPRSCARTLRFGREARVPPLLASVVPRFVLILFSVPGSTQLPPVAEGHDPPMLFLAGLFDVHKSADYHGGPLHTFTVVTTGTNRVGGWCSSARDSFARPFTDTTSHTHHTSPPSPGTRVKNLTRRCRGSTIACRSFSMRKAWVDGLTRRCPLMSLPRCFAPTLATWSGSASPRPSTNSRTR